MLVGAMLMLEGSTVRAGGNAWRSRSIGQDVDGHHRWLQVALVGRPFYVVLLKMSLTAREADAVRALEWWLAHPGHEDGDVIEVD